MALTSNKEKKTYETNRREFCKKAPCGAIGIVASSSILTNFLKVSTLPKVFAMMFDAQFPWLEDPNVSTSACPDAYNPVVFEISRRKEE